MWAKLDDQFADHPKVVRASDRAFRAHVRAMCYAAANLTDGRLPRQWVRDTLGLRIAAQLVALKLWDAFNDGDFLIHDWLDCNIPAEQELAKRKARAKAGRVGGIRSGESRRSKAEATEEANPEAIGSANGKQNRTPSPSPSPITTKSLESRLLGLCDKPNSKEAREVIHHLQTHVEPNVIEEALNWMETDMRTRAKYPRVLISVVRNRVGFEIPTSSWEKEKQRGKNSASRTQARTSMRKQSESEEAERARQLRELEAWNPAARQGGR